MPIIHGPLIYGPSICGPMVGNAIRFAPMDGNAHGLQHASPAIQSSAMPLSAASLLVMSIVHDPIVRCAIVCSPIAGNISSVAISFADPLPITPTMCGAWHRQTCRPQPHFPHHHPPLLATRIVCGPIMVLLAIPIVDRLPVHNTMLGNLYRQWSHCWQCSSSADPLPLSPTRMICNTIFCGLIVSNAHCCQQHGY